MPAGLGFMVQTILGIMGSQSLLYFGALSVRLSEGSLVIMAASSVRVRPFFKVFGAQRCTCRAR